MPDPHDRNSDNPHEEPTFARMVPENLRDRIRQMLGDFKLPKELVNQIMNQVDETKHAAIAIIAREVRTFLEKTNLSEEIIKVLTRISFEVSTNIRFVDNEDGKKRGVHFSMTRPKKENAPAEGSASKAQKAPQTASTERKRTPPRHPRQDNRNVTE
jgi:hypothetical protein